MRGAFIGGSLALAALMLAGCSQRSDTLSQALGVEQGGPDALNILKRPPLILPPDYNLRPPRPGEARLSQSDPGAEARRTLLGRDAAEGDGARAILTGEAAPGGLPTGEKSPPAEDGAVSAGQTALLARTNRVEQDPSTVVETRAENRVDGAFLRQLLSWQPPAENGAEAEKGGAPAVTLVRHEQTVLSPATSEPNDDRTEE